MTSPQHVFLRLETHTTLHLLPESLQTMGNCESRNAGTWNGMRNGTQNGNKMQSVLEIR